MGNLIVTIGVVLGAIIFMAITICSLEKSTMEFEQAVDACYEDICSED